MTLRVGSNVGVAGWIRSNHDARWFRPGTDILDDDAEPTYADMVKSSSTDNAPPYFAFDGAAVERIKFVWTPDEGWVTQTATARLLQLNPAGAGGNVRWRYKHFANYLNTAPTSSLVGIGDVTVATAPILGLGVAYNDVATAFALPRGALGEAPTFVTVLDRFATDAADTHDARDVGLMGLSLTRIGELGA